MFLFWRIRYLDTTDREFKDRDLWLDTETLDDVTKAAVEARTELKAYGGHREMLKYRHLFQPEDSIAVMQRRAEVSGHIASVFVHNYFEDENGTELSRKQMAVALTGSESAVMLPLGAQKHDIEYILAKKSPIDISVISLSREDLKILGYFTRDLKELRSSTFFKEGPGTLSGISVPGTPTALSTAVNDEEIRSFVTIFRRIYMATELANLANAAAVFKAALAGHPASQWIAAGAAEFAASLDKPPELVPFTGGHKPKFTVKRLIDVFLYTQYAHQPDEDRLRQFRTCLQEVGNDRAILTYLFSSELWSLSIQILNVGQYIANLFDNYCEHRNVACDVVLSPGDVHSGIGSLEKGHQREDRVVRERAEKLAAAMWKKAGEPPGGPHLFFPDALKRLREAMRAGN